MNEENPFDISTPEGNEAAFKFINEHGFVWVIRDNHLLYLSSKWIRNLGLANEGKNAKI